MQMSRWTARAKKFGTVLMVGILGLGVTAESIATDTETMAVHSQAVFSEEAAALEITTFAIPWYCDLFPFSKVCKK